MNSDIALHYSALPSAIGEQLGEEMAILNVETGTYFGLKGVGVDIWPRTFSNPGRDVQSSHD